MINSMEYGIGSAVDAACGRVRVVHLVSTLEIGGLEVVVLSMARHHDRSAFDVRVLCLDAIGALGPRFEALGVPVESLGGPGLGKSRMIRRLRTRLRALTPHVLHTHNPRPHLLGATAAAAAGIPVVVHTKHGRNSPEDRRAVSLNRLASALTTRIVPVSRDAAEVAQNIERIPPRKLRVIYNGIDLDDYPDRAPRQPGDLGSGIHVARLDEIKDQATLLRAVRLVVDAEPGFRLDIAGDGPARADLHRLCIELGLEEHVRFLGFRDDIGSLLAAADFFVLCSLSEGLSVSLLEAMAAGLPVVATDVGGNRELVAPGGTGLLVPTRAPGPLADAMLSLLRDPDLAYRMGTAGRRRVAEEFDVRDMVRKYEGLYLECLAARGRHAGTGRPRRSDPVGLSGGSR